MNKQKTMHGRGRKAKLEVALQSLIDSGIIDVYYTPYGKGELRCNVGSTETLSAKQFAIDYMYRRIHKPVAFTVRERQWNSDDKWHNHSDYATFEDAIAEVVKRTERYKR